MTTHTTGPADRTASTDGGAAAASGAGAAPVDGAGRPGAVVTLRFAPLPEHVRTARLVATAVARRIGLPDEQLDAVRLAVGEACARAVQRAEHVEDPELVSLQISHRAADAADTADGADCAVAGGADPGGDGSGRVHLEAVVVDVGGDDGVESEDVAMLLMEGLADQVLVGPGPGGPGGTTRLVWASLQRGG